MDVGAFCRQVEAHLARVNAGEIIRITGTGFELVRGWALEGIPLSVVCHAISVKAERHRAGRATRPLRIEFCATDVRAEYTTWCRAVGLTNRPAEDPGGRGVPADDRRRGSLAKHFQRAIDRLSVSASQADLEPAMHRVLDDALQAMAGLSERARGARGPAREAVLTELAALDARVILDARTALGADQLARLIGEAEAELASYRGRLPPDIWQRSVDLGVTRLLRDRLGLPTLEM
jgi:hypothetical protein